MKMMNCPFCGKQPKFISNPPFFRGSLGVHWALKCTRVGCHVNPQTAWFSGKGWAVNNWNRRKA